MSSFRYNFYIFSPVVFFLGTTITFSIFNSLPGPAIFLAMIIPGPLLIPVAILPIVLTLWWIHTMVFSKTDNQSTPIPRPDGKVVNLSKKEARTLYVQKHSKKYFFWMYVFIGCSSLSSLILLQMF